MAALAVGRRDGNVSTVKRVSPANGAKGAADCCHPYGVRCHDPGQAVTARAASLLVARRRWKKNVSLE